MAVMMNYGCRRSQMHTICELQMTAGSHVAVNVLYLQVLNLIKYFILYYINIYLEENNIKYLVIIYYELNLFIVLNQKFMQSNQLNCD